MTRNLYQHPIELLKREKLELREYLRRAKRRGNRATEESQQLDGVNAALRVLRDAQAEAKELVNVATLEVEEDGAEPEEYSFVIEGHSTEVATSLGPGIHPLYARRRKRDVETDNG